MSSYLSQPYQVQQPQESVNVQLVGATLNNLQSRYDVNKSIVDQTLAKYEMLRGLSSMDNEYIASRVKEAESVMENYRNKNGDLSRSTTRDTMLSALKSVANDPIVQNAVQNKQIYDNFNAEVSKLKEKNPEKYSNINYQDALEQGGVQAYMQGKVKKLGNLQYKDYINAPKVLDEKVAKWAKDYGYNTYINEVDGGLYYRNEKHEVLTKDKIINFVKTNLDPETQAQLQINARAIYDGMSDSDFNTTALEKYKTTKSTIDSRLSEEKAKLATASGDDLKIINENISYLESESSNLATKIKTGTFDRQDKYKFYENDLLNGIATNYAKDNIVDIDYNTIPLQIAQYNESVRHNKANELLEAYKLDGKNSKGQVANTGTQLPVIPEEDPNRLKPESEQIRNNFVQTEAELKNILSQEDPEYKKLKTLQERNAYVRNIMKLDPKVDLKAGNTLSTNVISAIKNHKNNYRVYSDYVNNISKNITELSKNQYDDMLGAKNLSLGNLSSSMPNTAEFLKKKLSFDSLSKVQQDIVRYERVANQIAFDNDLTTQQSAELKNYLLKLKSVNANNKVFQKAVEGVTIEPVGDSSISFFKDLVYGTVIKGVKNLIIDPLDYYKDLANNALFGSAEYGEKITQEFDRVQGEDWTDISKNLKRYTQSTADSSILGVFQQDTNITEVDTKEDTKSGRDMSSEFRKVIGNAITTGQTSLKDYLPTMPEKSSFSFSTSNKLQKDTANDISQIVLANLDDGAPVPIPSNDYNLNYNASENSFDITYLAKVDKEIKKQTIKVDAQLMPKGLKDNYQLSLSNWATDVKNPKASIPTFTYNPPYSLDESKSMLERLETIASNQFSSEDIANLRNSALFDTPKDRINTIYKAYPDLKKDPVKQEEINKVLNAKVDIENFVIKGVGFQLIPVIKYADGTEERVKTKTVVIPEYDPSNNLKMQIMLTSEALNQKIKDIAND